jgi:hypothetical protein
VSQTHFSLHQPCKIDDEAGTSCKLDTQVQVWEKPCAACGGSGYATSRRKGKSSTTAVCLLCTGIGYVRCASTRLSPHLEDGSGDVSGLGRSQW